MEFITKDSGKRESYVNGACRDTNEGKGYYFCIPPHGIERLAKLLQRGANKYGVSNFRKGITLSRYLDSAFRHLFQFAEGENTEDHLAAVAFNVLGLMQTQKDIEAGILPKELDDLHQTRTGYTKEEFDAKNQKKI